MMDAVSLKPSELQSVLDKLKTVWATLPHMRTLIRYGKKTFDEFIQGFRDSFVRDAIRFFVDAPNWPLPSFPMTGLAGMMSSFVTETGVPLGGSQEVIFRIAEKYQKLGGEIIYDQRVTDVMIENNRAVGIRLEDGSEHRADIVVWAGDGHTIVFDILGGKYLDDRIRAMYREWIPVVPLVQVSLGVARDLSNGRTANLPWKSRFLLPARNAPGLPCAIAASIRTWRLHANRLPKSGIRHLMSTGRNWPVTGRNMKMKNAELRT
jgi:phytoene dehydrogenase-like protein